MASSILVLNTTLLVPPVGACAATTAWLGKNTNAVWRFDVSLIHGDCSADDVTVAYHRVSRYSYKYSIDEWRAGSCEYSTGSSDHLLTRAELLSRGEDYDYAVCGGSGTSHRSSVPCQGYIGQLDEFAADHLASERFSCDQAPYTLYAASASARACNLSVIVWAERSDANFEFCEAYAASADFIVGIIVGVLVFAGVLTCFCALTVESDTHVGRRVRAFNRACCSALTCNYLCGTCPACVRKHFEPTPEAALKSLKDMECLDSVCFFCAPRESRVAANSQRQTQPV